MGWSISVALLVTLLATLLWGCRGKPVPVGTFRGSRTTAFTPGTDPVVAAQLDRVELRLDEGGKGVLEEGGIPFEGAVSRSGDDLDMEVLAISGVNIDRQPAGSPRALKFRIAGSDAIEYRGVEMKRIEK